MRASITGVLLALIVGMLAIAQVNAGDGGSANFRPGELKRRATGGGGYEVYSTIGGGGGFAVFSEASVASCDGDRQRC